MKLGLQLTLVCCTLLLVPWSGCEFLRANEQALRAVQQQGLESTGRAIADGLANQISLLYPDPSRARSPLTEGSLVAHSLTAEPINDGYFDDWPEIPWQSFGIARRPFDVVAGVSAETLYLAIKVRDTSKRFNTKASATEASGDRLILTTWINQQRQRYEIATAAPGRVKARPLGRTLRSASAEAISGEWVDVAEGYQIELSMPLSTATSRLGVMYIDEDQGGVSTRGNIAALDTTAPPWLIYATENLQDWVSRYQASAIGVAIYDRWGWPLASTRPSMEPTADAFWMTHWLYEAILGKPETTTRGTLLADGRSNDPLIAQAIRGLTGTELISDSDDLFSRLATPIQSRDGVIGIVVVDQPRQQYLTLSANAFEGLITRATVALLIGLIGLLGFAGLTSYRIRRLTRAMANSHEELPVSRMGDEIDALAQQVNALRTQQEKTQTYLRSLPRMLAHEIRTPVAIVHSSLQHLRDETLAADARNTLVDRAGEGVVRLTEMLSSMNEANRLEESIADEVEHDVDLRALLNDLASAYRVTFPDWTFTTPKDNEPAITAIAPERIVQALDKLVSNATSYAPQGSAIELRVARRGLWWRITVVNDGPLLTADTDQLFAPMVSFRNSARSESSSNHMGLGLYIVALIARHHGGEPWSRNRADGTGVEIGFTVRA